MGVANPIWLWGMLGLMVPIAIHLLSRKDMRVIHVLSLPRLTRSSSDGERSGYVTTEMVRRDLLPVCGTTVIWPAAPT